MTKDKLEELLERMKEAEGPDKVLDASIELDVEPGRFWAAPSEDSPNFTGSVDAALAFAERVLPGWMYNVGNVGPDEECWACLTQPEGDCTDFGAGAPSIPLAILTATLSALIAQDDAQ